MLEQGLATFLHNPALIESLLVIIDAKGCRLFIVDGVEKFWTLAGAIWIVHGGLMLLARVSLLVSRQHDLLRLIL